MTGPRGAATADPRDRALENIFMLARRRQRRAIEVDEIEAWGHIIRFCREAGLKPSILRAEMEPGREKTERACPKYTMSSKRGFEGLCRTCWRPQAEHV